MRMKILTKVKLEPIAFDFNPLISIQRCVAVEMERHDRSYSFLEEHKFNSVESAVVVGQVTHSDLFLKTIKRCPNIMRLVRFSNTRQHPESAPSYGIWISPFGYRSIFLSSLTTHDMDLDDD